MTSLFYRSKKLGRAANRVISILQSNMYRSYISLVVPYKTLAFFVEYFDTIEEIDLERRGISDGNGGRGSSPSSNASTFSTFTLHRFNSLTECFSLTLFTKSPAKWSSI